MFFSKVIFKNMTDPDDTGQVDLQHEWVNEIDAMYELQRWVLLCADRSVLPLNSWERYQEITFAIC